MNTRSLWGKLDDLETVITPAAILKEQAAILTRITNRALLCQVDLEPSYKIRHNMRIIAPSLNNYTYNILSIEHTVSIYPVTIQSTHLPDRPYTECETQGAFEDRIENILSSQSLKTIISRLLSQAK